MIYFITQGKEYVKIGVSGTPGARLNELQTGNPNKLSLWFVVRGGTQEERALHAIFA